MRAMNGLIPDQYEGELDGRIELLGKSLGEFSSGELARTIGNVFQNPTDQFFTRKAADEVARVGENLGMPREELIERVESAFESMKIAHLAGKDLIGLSGGEKQRVAIASTLVYDTQVIFFDEPSASLDHEGIEDFRRILADLKALGKTVVIAEHRLYFLADLYDRLHVMAGGQIVDSFAAGRLRAEDCARYGLRALDLHCLNEGRFGLRRRASPDRALDALFARGRGYGRPWGKRSRKEYARPGDVRPCRRSTGLLVGSSASAEASPLVLHDARRRLPVVLRHGGKRNPDRPEEHRQRPSR